MTTEKLYLAWQDQKNRNWWPIGILTHDDDQKYRFRYTRGAEILKEKGIFKTFAGMRDLDLVYESKDLFPLFSNRVIQETRPEYKRYLNWLDSFVDTHDPLTFLSITEGIKVSDNLEVFSCPQEKIKGRYEAFFLVHGLRYLTESSIERINQLQKGERLYLIYDMQNDYDDKAVALRTNDPADIVGYCPRYLSREILDLFDKTNNVKVTVERINHEAPLHVRLLCRITARWPEDFVPCSDEKFRPIVDDLEKEIETASKDNETIKHK